MSNWPLKLGTELGIRLEIASQGHAGEILEYHNSNIDDVTPWTILNKGVNLSDYAEGDQLI